MKSEESTLCTQENNPEVTPRWQAALEQADAASRCSAKTRKGNACLSPAMPNGRCRMHGGKSTGACTEEGKKRVRKANWKHGFYAFETATQRQKIQSLMRQYKNFLKSSCF